MFLNCTIYKGSGSKKVLLPGAETSLSARVPRTPTLTSLASCTSAYTIIQNIILTNRMTYTEDKAKVVTEFFKFLIALAVLHKDDMKKRMTYSSNRPGGK